MRSIVAAALLSVLCCGCLRIEVTVFVRPDGSGRIVERLLMMSIDPNETKADGPTSLAMIGAGRFVTWRHLREIRGDDGDRPILWTGVETTRAFDDISYVSLEINRPPPGAARSEPQLLRFTRTPRGIVAHMPKRPLHPDLLTRPTIETAFHVTVDVEGVPRRFDLLRYEGAMLKSLRKTWRDEPKTEADTYARINESGVGLHVETRPALLLR